MDTWERGSQLDPDLGMMLPDVCRMFAYWQYFDSAREYLARERFDLRLRFYTALIAFKEGLIPEAEETWTRIVEYDYDHRALTDGFDEFAEACVRLTRPGLALEVLAPLMRDQDIDYYRLLLAGLAWAQQRAIRHAKETLDIALRVAELGRPRRTRPGGKTRILDARSRILYGEVTIDADVRQELDQYFIPGKA